METGMGVDWGLMVLLENGLFVYTSHHEMVHCYRDSPSRLSVYRPFLQNQLLITDSNCSTQLVQRCPTGAFLASALRHSHPSLREHHLESNPSRRL